MFRLEFFNKGKAETICGQINRRIKHRHRCEGTERGGWREMCCGWLQYNLPGHRPIPQKHEHSSEDRCKYPYAAHLHAALRGGSQVRGVRRALTLKAEVTPQPLHVAVGKKDAPPWPDRRKVERKPPALVSAGRGRVRGGAVGETSEAGAERCGQTSAAGYRELLPNTLSTRGLRRGGGRCAAASTCVSGAQRRRLRRPQWFLLREEAARLVPLLLGRAWAVGTAAPGAGCAAAPRRALASEEGSDSSAPASAGTWRSVETLRHAQVGVAQALMGESGRGGMLGPRGAGRSAVPPRRGPSPSLSVLPPHAAPRWSRPGAAHSAPWRLDHARRHSNPVRDRRRGGGRRPRPRRAGGARAAPPQAGCRQALPPPERPARLPRVKGSRPDFGPRCQPHVFRTDESASRPPSAPIHGTDSQLPTSARLVCICGQFWGRGRYPCHTFLQTHESLETAFSKRQYSIVIASPQE